MTTPPSDWETEKKIQMLKVRLAKELLLRMKKKNNRNML